MQSTGSTDPETLKAFEAVCENATRAVRQAGTMREAMEASEVTEPAPLKGIGRLLPGHGRLRKALANRLDDLLAIQLEAASRIRDRNDLERELDRLKVREWYVLRSEYPELYSKGIAHAAQLVRRMEALRKRR